MALLDLIASTPPEARVLGLDAVGARTRLDRDGAEFLLMKVWHLVLGWWRCNLGFGFDATGF